MGKRSFKNGAVYFVYDVSDGLYDNSYIGFAMDENDFPDLDEYLWMISDQGLYELTDEGYELLEEWRNDVSCGYDLCNGRCKGLAQSIGSREIDIFNHLIKFECYSRKVS